MASPLLLGLQDEFSVTRKALLNFFGVASHNNQQPRGRQPLGAPYDMAEHRNTAQLVQHLRSSRLHSCPLARSQDDDRRLAQLNAP